MTLKCLAKKPDARYQSADDLLAALERIQSNLQTDATKTVTRLIHATAEPRASGTLATISDIFRRPRLPVGYVALAVVALVTLTIGIWYFARPRAHQPPGAAESARAPRATGGSAL